MQKYNNIDGLRTLAAISIIIMHVWANIGYQIFENESINNVINNIFPRLASFVELFFIISGFGMCCGYYEKIKENKISLDKFYSKRYVKILPFFTTLVVVDLAVTFITGGGINTGSIYEAFADLTLLFGFLPVSNITVIGVGWTLGVIFGFYVLFPFFVYLIWNKKRAWLSLFIMIGLNFVCSVYFLDAGNLVRCNVIRWFCYFIVGGLIYLYLDKIKKIISNSIIGIVTTLFGFIIVFCIQIDCKTELDYFFSTIRDIIGYALILIGVLCEDIKLWSNPVSKFISKISLEIYISHMMIYRVFEKLGLTAICGESFFSYVIVCIATIVGVVVFAVVFQWIENKIKNKLLN